ncbi:helix-turn-helix domain-containing protein [Apilactobacillus quenuiae]|uniref:helix-turn-helix domain-containing protein n=1 Tax=Apilactobacillus quenuiae TaxID=2008377 RepID=UPI000D01710C|nr:helix-turn-helix transcriptional regulator [Apilactobacillus quenuiae]
MNLGERLKDLRDDREVSIQELANGTNISAHKIYNFEISNDKPNMFQINKISKYYEIPINQVANKEDVELEVKRRYLISNLSMIPLLFSFIFLSHNLLITCPLIIIGAIGGGYATHWKDMNEMLEPFGFQNPIAKWIKSKLTRVVSYTLSITLLLAGILLMIINFDRLGAFGAMLLDGGIVAVLASVMVWDANKN